MADMEGPYLVFLLATWLNPLDIYVLQISKYSRLQKANVAK